MYVYMCIETRIIYEETFKIDSNFLQNMVLRDLHKLQYSSKTFNLLFWRFLVTGQSDVSNMKHASYIISVLTLTWSLK